MGVQVGFAGRFVSYRGCDRELRPTQVDISAGQPPKGARQESQAHYRSISELEHIEQYGGMGSVPAGINPHLGLMLRTSASIRAAQQPGGHHRALGLAPSLIPVVIAPRSGARALLTGWFSGRRTSPCGTCWSAGLCSHGPFRPLAVVGTNPRGTLKVHRRYVPGQ
jgi:hypothetical protein